MKLSQSTNFNSPNIPTKLGFIMSILGDIPRLEVECQNILDTLNLNLKIANDAYLIRVLKESKSIAFVLEEADNRFDGRGLSLDLQSYDNNCVNYGIHESLSVYDLDYLNAVITFLNTKSKSLDYYLFFSTRDNYCQLCYDVKYITCPGEAVKIKGPIKEPLTSFHQLLPEIVNNAYPETGVVKDYLILHEDYIEHKISGKTFMGLELSDCRKNYSLSHFEDGPISALVNVYSNIKVSTGSSYFYQDNNEFYLIPSNELLLSLDNNKVSYSVKNLGKLKVIRVQEDFMLVPINSNGSNFGIITYKPAQLRIEK